MNRVRLFVLLFLLGITGILFANNALYFDGVDDCVQIASPGITNTFTAECWFKPYSAGLTGTYGSTIMGSSTGTARSYWLTLVDDELRLWAFQSNASQLWTSTNLDIQVGTWYHVAVTAVRNGAFNVYLNGQLVGSGTAGNFTDMNNQLTLGDLRPGRGLAFHGLLDEVRIWNVVRTQTEIANNMNTIISPYPSSLLGYWPLDSANGSTVYDMTTPSQNGNTQNGLVSNPNPGFYNSDVTLPVEMSSFMVTGTSDFFVRLTWITQTETSVMGYYVYRNTQDNFATATRISDLIPAQNQTNTTHYTYIDEEVSEGTWYYWLQNIDYDGQDEVHGPVSYTVIYGTEEPITPPPAPVTKLKDVFPNPFNPMSYIPFYLDSQQNVRVDVINLKGQVIKTVFQGLTLPGDHVANWDGKDANGEACSTGIYMIRLTAGDKVFTKKAMLIK